MQITSYDIDQLELKGEIVFNIVELTNDPLAITSKPMSDNQVTMHFKPEKTE